MTNKVGIGVEAQFDTSSVERALNTLGSKIAAANKVQFTPFSGKTQADIQKVIQQFEQLRKIHGDLNKRMNATGQGGASLFNVDFDKMYPDPASRARVMRKVFEYSTGASFGAMQPPPPNKPPGGGAGTAGGGSGGGGGGGWRQGAANVAQAGLRAAGPAGGVAAGAIGTGMSAGFGAGMMGLMGGMLALGVSKFVGAVMERVGQAEDQAVALDRLKRTLGDVNVSFGALKAVVHGGADNLKITYAEAEKLATQFTKLGNVSAEQYKTLGDEIGVGVGLSRAFGMDPSQGVGALGQMRGIGATSNTQESRRFALLIGETIGKSGAFAKADEVMDALTNYTVTQTRQMLGRANTQGYAGMFAGLVSSGIPGLDPAGAAGLLGRVNAALTGGGAKGEASQFFSAQVGAGMGLDPIQTMMLREGGAFATNDAMFGKDSAYARFMGGEGPGGGSTFLGSTLERLRGAYGNNKGMLAMATANHLGVGINQAMGLLSVDPKKMGEMGKYANLGSLSGSGIANMAKVFGSDSERSGVAQSMLMRSDVSNADKDKLRGAMGTDSEKEVLATLTAQYDQERTQGTDIRDSKNALDNIKSSLAEYLIPLTQSMRDGILYMAGGMKKSRSEVLQDIASLESKDRVRGIDSQFESDLKKAGGERLAAQQAIQALMEKNRGKLMGGEMTQEQHAAEMAPLQERLKRATLADGEARERHRKALEEESKELEKQVEQIRQANLPTKASFSGGAGAGRGLINPPLVGAAPASGSVGGDLGAILAAEEKRVGLPSGTLASIIQQETGGKKDYLDDPGKYHYPMGSDGRRRGRSGAPSSAFGPFGILADSTAKDPGFGVSPLKDKSLTEQARFAADYLAARSKAAGSLRGGLAGYGEGYAYADSVMSRIGTQLPPSNAAASQPAPGHTSLSGELSLRLDLAGDAAKMFKQSHAPIFTQVHSNWRN